MTKEQLQTAIALDSQIEKLKKKLNQSSGALSELEAEADVSSKVKGIDVVLPKAVFISELNRQKRAIEDELADLQSQFDAV